jgi:hypothetical protein
MPNVALQERETYLVEGVFLRGDQLRVDLAQPRSIVVHGVNSKTGEVKDYLLRVTGSGRLVLQ